MNLDALDLFVAVARRGSFAAVARDRDVDPSTISRAIGELEAELGLRLFQRSTRSLRLTEAGDLYLARVEPLADELARARDEAMNVTRTPHGVLRLTASVPFGQVRIMPLLAEFRRLYPGLKLECLFTDDNVDLIADRIDLAIRLGPAIEGDLIAARLMDTRYRVVASPAYLDCHPPPTKPADLSRHRVLQFNVHAYRSRWLFRHAAGRVEEVPIDGDITLSPVSALLAAAIDGIGPALLPDWLVDDAIADGRLVHLLRECDAAATTFDTGAWLVYPSRAYLPTKVRVMIEFLKRRIGRK
jgi:DNA-binding transcriptional LysR family regulator